MTALDLHVLGLPLAFILSQDQTLHGMNISLPPSLLMLFNVPSLYPFFKSGVQIYEQIPLFSKSFFSFLSLFLINN